jgi:hypothetical protein
MQTRIQLTIKDEDRDALYDKTVELEQWIFDNQEKFPFDIDVYTYANEPETE